MNEEAEYDIKIRQGDTFSFRLTYRSGGAAVDLTGYTAEMIISWPAFTFDDAPPLEAGEIACTMAALDDTGIIVASLTNAQTATIPVSGVEHAGPRVLYQLRIRVSDDPVITLVAGKCEVSPDIFELVV